MVLDAPSRFNYPKDISLMTKISERCTLVSGSTESIESFAKTVSNVGFAAKEIDCFGIDIAGVLKKNNYSALLKKELEKVR